MPKLGHFDPPMAVDAQTEFACNAVVPRRTETVTPLQGGNDMTGLIAKSFESPDEVRSPDKTTLEVVDLGGVKVGRFTAQPGWTWTECIKPVVGVIVSGTLHVKHNDGSEGDATAGTAYIIEPGHDAWVVGDEPVVAFEFDSSTAQTYATSG